MISALCTARKSPFEIATVESGTSAGPLTIRAAARSISWSNHGKSEHKLTKQTIHAFHGLPNLGFFIGNQRCILNQERSFGFTAVPIRMPLNAKTSANVISHFHAISLIVTLIWKSRVFFARDHLRLDLRSQF
jgi:hypothetical protein